MKKINIAKTWGTKTPQGAEIPRNAIYGKVGHIYYYVSDKGKKSLANESKYAEIFVLDDRSKHKNFRQTIVEQKDNAICDFIKYIAYRGTNNWLDTSEPCTFSLGINKANVTPRYNTDSLNQRLPKFMDRHDHKPVGECASSAIAGKGYVKTPQFEKQVMTEEELKKFLEKKKEKKDFRNIYVYNTKTKRLCYKFDIAKSLKDFCKFFEVDKYIPFNEKYTEADILNYIEFASQNRKQYTFEVK